MIEVDIKIGDFFVSLFVLLLFFVKLIVFIFYLEFIDFFRFFLVLWLKYGRLLN